MSGTAITPLALVLLAASVTFLWRALGAVLASKIDTEGALFRWIACVSYATVAGLISRMAVLPTGELAETPLALRLGAVAIGFAVYFLARRNLLLAAAAGAASFAGGLALLPV
ncbi:MAG: AzlD domain-containing protein [Nisaea sp.]|jgi:branched-subunit amino acid transport protein|uniref:AzlD domain-containing protein n=1 Tax=Nisaea sp. TaxID=2024842 RepID=UPI001B1632E3|nr:AzlD domain-containing protein [Nisaea sp.]MBO6560134.1 AzlD domain-containing protein [Nisaea sp.]